METWILPALLGLGLAAATGLRTFLPLLLLAGSARMGLFGVELNSHVAWMTSTPMLVGLGVATAAELAADKIPVVDHALSAMGTVTRPLAAALAAGSVFTHADPGMAAMAGLIIGVPTALTFQSAQSSARFISTATTAGLGNPVLSMLEDLAAGLLAVIAIAAPVIAAIIVAGLIFVAVNVLSLFRRGAPG